MPSTPIVIAFTPNYLIPAATTLLSILKSSNESDMYDIVCLLSEVLTEDERNGLINLDSNRLKFNFLLLEDKLKDIYIDQRYSVAASYRLLLPDLLPQYSSVVYLDCDIIVRNNIANLYRETNLRQNYLAAVYEATLDFQIPYLEKIGCTPGKYFNSGFLIMNLAKMRDDNISDILIQKSNNPDFDFPDQDALNIVCKDRIIGLKPIYNSIRTYFLPQYKEGFLKYYSESDWQDVQNHGTVHYTGAKPWNSYTIMFDIWWKYYKKLPRSVKAFGTINKKLLLIAELKRIRIVNTCFKVIQYLYRKYKN